VRIRSPLTLTLSRGERGLCVHRAYSLSLWERAGVRAIAKCVALGASLGGIAGQFLKAAAVSTEKIVEMMKLTKRQIEVTMFSAGIESISNLDNSSLVQVRR
jgi:isopentenyl diphosphate isomerase/L-lactate dehydrogenase-like FMN-dependent dehydrogenase